MLSTGWRNPSMVNNVDSVGSSCWNDINNVKVANSNGAMVLTGVNTAWSNIFTMTVNATAVNITNWIGSSINTSPVMPSTIGGRPVRTALNTTFGTKTALTGAYIGNAKLTSNTVATNGFRASTNLLKVDKIPLRFDGGATTTVRNTFNGCSNLVNAPVIPEGVTDMVNTFSSCTNLVNAPVIPNSVTNMAFTFSDCTRLVNAPVIPNSVTNMVFTFFGCTNLVDAPVISNSVTNMSNTFSSCTNLVNAPVIPEGVTDMTSTFRSCTNLTGNITILSPEVGALQNTFNNTTAAKTVRVPAGSNTYTRAVANWDGKNGVTVVGI